MKAQGYAIGIVNLTRGELGTRGTPELRKQEADTSAEILELDFHLNLGLPDGGILNIPGQRMVVVAAIRSVRPNILLCNAVDDRHPDHGNAATLVKEAAFLAGLRSIVTLDDLGKSQEAFRPQVVLHYVQDRYPLYGKENGSYQGFQKPVL
jgi:N-acetylglucosamine malate deacetylase 1